MDKENNTIKAGVKRTRSVISRISDAGTSVSEQKNTPKKKRKSKQIKGVMHKTICKMNKRSISHPIAIAYTKNQRQQ
ncbi:hypothetical protein DPMN_170782 [Dreissena polymorpha]|uniref:Uncharacterized protein n=1 Tax=Dreissena polymorpha TaxID=45954 RepID=A0A9D4DWT5_DREPO|nr:hypothetical protein DPMN_170782 [Dreissena polymorpha]